MFQVKKIEEKYQRGIKEINLYLELQEKEKIVILAYVYGFKNISNLIRKLKRNQNQYSYVEIMACPGGCIKGGG